MLILDGNSDATFSLCRQLVFEPHRNMQPSLLINTQCPFNCTGEGNTKGRIVMRYHCQDWAHIRCSNLDCMYRPYSVKQPLNLRAILCPPQNASPEEVLHFQMKQATFAGMVRFEKSIVNQDDFKVEFAKDKALIENSLVASGSRSSLPLMNTRTSLDQTIDPGNNIAEESSSFANVLQKRNQSDDEEDKDYKPPGYIKRGRKKKDLSLPRTSSYKPNGRKRGRPKGFSPIKARQQMAQMFNREKEETPFEEITPTKYELVQLGTTEGVNYISQKSMQKKNAAFSLKKAAATLFVCSKGKDQEKARTYFMKAMLLAGKISKAKKSKKKAKLHMKMTGYSSPKNLNHQFDVKAEATEETVEADEIIEIVVESPIKAMKARNPACKKEKAPIWSSPVKNSPVKNRRAKATRRKRDDQFGGQLDKGAEKVISPAKKLKASNAPLWVKEEGESRNWSPLKADTTKQKSLSPKCSEDVVVLMVSDGDRSRRKKTSPVKKERRAKEIKREREENSIPTMTHDVKNVTKCKEMSSRDERRLNRTKIIQCMEEKAIKEENASIKEDLAEKPEAKAERKIPALPSESGSKHRTSVKNMIKQLALTQGDKTSRDLKPVKFEIQAVVEEKVEADTVPEKMEPQLRTYLGPKKRKAIRPVDDVISPKVSSPEVVAKQCVLEKDEKVKSSPDQKKDLLKLWTDPVLIYKDSSPVEKSLENARRTLSFSNKDKVMDVADQDHDVSGVKGILKSAPKPEGRFKKMVRFSNPL